MLLEKQAKKELEQTKQNNLNHFKKFKTVKELNDFLSGWWYFRTLLNKKELETVQKTKSIKEAKTIIKKAIEREHEKDLKKALKMINAIKSNDFKQCQWGVCSIDWIKNRTWGNCPRGEYRNGHVYKEYRSITGCGFDKLSTLTADMFNEDMFLRSYVCNYIEKHAINKDNIREKLGYGIHLTHGRPVFDGGVGVECHLRILKKLGFKVTHNETQRSDYIEYSK